jgi:hypothetical protein
MNSTETLLCTACAVSFASTFVLLVLSILQRLTPALKLRLLQRAFSFQLNRRCRFHPGPHVSSTGTMGRALCPPLAREHNRQV